MSMFLTGTFFDILVCLDVLHSKIQYKTPEQKKENMQ